MSGTATHLLPINPPYGGLILGSVWCGRSAKKTESAIMAPAAITKIACCSIPPICARNPLSASLPAWGWASCL